MRMGPCHLVHCANIKTINGNVLNWVNELRYLGVYLVSSNKFKCNYAYARKSFYRSFNAIFGRVGRLGNVLYLIKAKCLPVLLYGLEVCPVSVSDMRSLEFTVKRIMIKLFRTYDSGIINSCVSHFDFPTVSELVGQRINMFLLKRNSLDNILFKVCQSLQYTSSVLDVYRATTCVVVCVFLYVDCVCLSFFVFFSLFMLLSKFFR